MKVLEVEKGKEEDVAREFLKKRKVVAVVEGREKLKEKKVKELVRRADVVLLVKEG